MLLYAFLTFNNPLAAPFKISPRWVGGRILQMELPGIKSGHLKPTCAKAL